MATAPVSKDGLPQEGLSQDSLSQGGVKKRTSRRRKTSHLKNVPQSRDLREKLRQDCAKVAAKLDKENPLTKDEMEQVARRVLSEAGQPESYVGWAMVMLASEFWRDQVAAIPPSRRLFLLPHCLKHAEGCPADYDQFGLDCKTCGACSIADFRSMAEDMGYKVLVAEGSPIVLKIIVSGYVDAICGVACLNVLEKAIDKILLAGIPCMAVPLLSSDCRNTAVDEDWVDEMIQIQSSQPQQATRSYVHLMRAANQLFENGEMERLAPRLRGSSPLEGSGAESLAAVDPIAATEALAYDFLAKGGKHSRPFITLAAYDAMRGGDCTKADGDRAAADLPDGVRKAAMSIETFHKASLVHDDIQDDDAFRYGAETMHRVHGAPTAINVGDYLIGLGYRLVSREASELGADACAAVLDTLAASHLRLSEGQGAELVWRDSLQKQLKPIDALKIYALKTAPAFEAALYSGVRLAVDDMTPWADPIRQFSRNLGVAFQILNDLQDWLGDENNKLDAGGDILGGRPTVLWALALESLEGADRDKLADCVEGRGAASDLDHASRIRQVRQLYEQAGVFDKAHRLVDKHQDRAEAVADKLDNDELRRLLYFLVDTVLERPDEIQPAPTLQQLGSANQQT